jgi:MazG family protein
MERYTYEQLLEIIAELRSDHGCPWDRAQTHESMIKCLYDECDEVVEAIKNKDDENLCEELGDVLLQVLLHAQIAAEESRFTMADVVDGIARKMVRRHPHVFGNAPMAQSEEEGLANWEAVKAMEKEEKKRRACKSEENI